MSKTMMVLVLLATFSDPLLSKGIVKFGEGETSFGIEFVQIGDPGNSADARVEFLDRDTGSPYHLGQVDYEYSIGKHEVSCGSLAISLELRGERPDGVLCGSEAIQDLREIGFGDFFHAADFVNWLNTSSGYRAAYKVERIPGQISGGPWKPGDVGFDPELPFRNSLTVFPTNSRRIL